jgi:pyrrolidone-carboxylate peptidase
MKNVLLSGFSEYGDYPANSAELVAKSLNGMELQGYQVHSRIFPATIPSTGTNRGLDLFNEADSLGSRAIISLGMSSDKKGLCVETRTANIIFNKKYCSPEQNGRAIYNSCQHGQKHDLDVSKWNINQFQSLCKSAGIFTEVSVEAGGFCCNHLMFQLFWTARIMRKHREIPWIYIHVPCSPEALPCTLKEFNQSGKITMSTEDMIRGLEILLSVAEI